MAGGRPKGSVKAKIMSDALILALKDAAGDGKTKKLQSVANALIARAIEGDVPAIKEVFDRVDGKVPQANTHEGGDTPITLLFKHAFKTKI